MIWLLTCRYWDLDQLVIENYKINYGLRYEPSKTHTKAIYLAFMRSPYSYFVSRDSFSKTNRFAKEIDCKTVGLFFSKSVKKSVKRREKPRSRPFVWLLARTWIRKNTDCFAVYHRKRTYWFYQWLNIQWLHYLIWIRRCSISKARVVKFSIALTGGLGEEEGLCTWNMMFSTILSTF